MRAREFIIETGDDVWVTSDKYGGEIRIRPDPRINSTPTTFSLSYINKTMAKYYRVRPRILGFDSHGHRGVPDVHLHAFSRKEKDQIKLSNTVLNNSYVVILSTFFDLYTAVIAKFVKDIKSGKIKRN